MEQKKDGPKAIRKCVECGEKRPFVNQGVFDMYGRFWCEDCLIFVLGSLTPATLRKRAIGKDR